MDNDGILDFNEFKVMTMTIVKGSFLHYVKGSDQGSPAEVERQRHGGGGKVVEGEIKTFLLFRKWQENKSLKVRPYSSTNI